MEERSLASSPRSQGKPIAMGANVMIATPTVDGQVGSRYTHSVMRLQAQGAARGEVFSLPYFIEFSLVPVARNALISIMLERKEHTHILFVDADIGFDFEAVAQMLDFDQPFTACAYPRRGEEPRRLHSVARAVDDPTLAWSVAQQYVGFESVVGTPNGSGGMQLEVRGGFVRTGRVGMGLTLIRRDALETLREAFSELDRPASPLFKQLGVRERVFQAFESTPNADGIYLSEDFAFCERWTQTCHGEIWLNADPVITHTGAATFSGRLMDRLQYGGRIA